MTADKPNTGTVLGRPSTFSQQLADQICLALMEGDSLRKICAQDGMPSKSTVLLWALNDTKFKDQYDRARKIAAEVEFDEIKDIADTPEIGQRVTVRGTGEKQVTETVTIDMVEHRRLRIDARKWSLARKDPKRYGDKLQQEHSGPGGGPIQVDNVSLTDAERADRVAAILDAARARAAGPSAQPAQDMGAAAGTADSSVPE